MAYQNSTAVRNAKNDAWQYGACIGAQGSGVTLNVWAQSTSYTAFSDWAVAGGSLYMCRVGGTSNSTGAGPTGDGLNIADGSTVKWTYIGSAGIGPAAVLRIYAGSVPASCAASESGTLLVEFDLATNYAGLAASAVKTLSSLPISAVAGAGGTGTNATHYRIYESTGTTCHEQGTVTATGGGGDATIDNISIATSQTVYLTAFSMTEPGA